MYDYVLREETDLPLFRAWLHQVLHACQIIHLQFCNFKKQQAFIKLVISCVLNIYQITEMISLIFCSSLYENSGYDIDTSETPVRRGTVNVRTKGMERV